MNQTLLKFIKEKYGTTENPTKGVFILPDGELLKMAEDEDHADMAHWTYLEIDPEHPLTGEMTEDEADEHLSDDLVNFQQDTGSIRFSGFRNAAVIDLHVVPTREQIKTLKEFYGDKMLTIEAGAGVSEYVSPIQRALRVSIR